MALPFLKFRGLTTFQSSLERQERLQPEIEDMARRLRISRNDTPERWAQLVRLMVDEDFSPLLSSPFNFRPPAQKLPTFTSEELLEVVTVNVGKDEERKGFKIHKKFAIDCSQVFKTAFTGGFAEAVTQSMDLDDVNTDVFCLFVQWLYTRDIRKENKKLPAGDLLIRLWVLADRLMAPKLQNKAISAIEEKTMREDFTVRTDQVKYIYDNTTPGSPLRRLIVDQCSNIHHASFIAHRPINDYPKEMLFDLVAVLLERRCREVQPLVDMTRFFVDEPSD